MLFSVSIVVFLIDLLEMRLAHMLTLEIFIFVFFIIRIADINAFFFSDGIDHHFFFYSHFSIALDCISFRLLAE